MVFWIMKSIDYNKERTCPCKKKSFWKCNDQNSCPQAVWELMRRHSIKLTPTLLVSDICKK